MRRRAASVIAAFAVLVLLGAVGMLAYAAAAPDPPPPQQPDGVECDNPYSIEHDPVCVAWWKYQGMFPYRGHATPHTVLGRDIPTIELLVLASLVLGAVAVGLVWGSRSDRTNAVERSAERFGMKTWILLAAVVVVLVVSVGAALGAHHQDAPLPRIPTSA